MATSAREGGSRKPTHTHTHTIPRTRVRVRVPVFVCCACLLRGDRFPYALPASRKGASPAWQIGYNLLTQQVQSAPPEACPRVRTHASARDRLRQQKTQRRSGRCVFANDTDTRRRMRRRLPPACRVATAVASTFKP